MIWTRFNSVRPIPFHSLPVPLHNSPFCPIPPPFYSNPFRSSPIHFLPRHASPILSSPISLQCNSLDAVAPVAGDAQISAQGSTNTASQMNVIAGIARSVVGFLVPCLPFIHRLVARIVSIWRAARILAKGAMSIHRSKVIAKQREMVGGWVDWV